MTSVTSAVLAADGFVRPDLDYHAFAPEFVLVGTLVVVLLVDLFASEESKGALSGLSGIGILELRTPQCRWRGRGQPCGRDVRRLSAPAGPSWRASGRAGDTGPGRTQCRRRPGPGSR